MGRFWGSTPDGVTVCLLSSQSADGPGCPAELTRRRPDRLVLGSRSRGRLRPFCRKSRTIPVSFLHTLISVLAFQTTLLTAVRVAEQTTRSCKNMLTSPKQKHDHVSCSGCFQRHENAAGNGDKPSGGGGGVVYQHPTPLTGLSSCDGAHSRIPWQGRVSGPRPAPPVWSAGPGGRLKLGSSP